MVERSFDKGDMDVEKPRLIESMKQIAQQN
jgi:hypothetical protein